MRFPEIQNKVARARAMFVFTKKKTKLTIVFLRNDENTQPSNASFTKEIYYCNVAISCKEVLSN